MKKLTLRTKILCLLFLIALGIITVIGLCKFDMNEILKTVETMPIGLKALSMIGLIAAQIFLAFLPGEPLELASGYLFGAWSGTLICLIGSFIGTLLVYCLVRVFRHKIIDVMFDSDKVKEAENLVASKKSMFWIFVLFLIFSVLSVEVSNGLYDIGELFIPAIYAHSAKLKSFALLLK